MITEQQPMDILDIRFGLTLPSDVFYSISDDSKISSTLDENVGSLTIKDLKLLSPIILDFAKKKSPQKCLKKIIRYTKRYFELNR